MSTVRAVLGGGTRRGARAVAALFGRDASDPAVMAGATLVTMALVSLITDTVWKAPDD